LMTSSFNGHPPLGVNATEIARDAVKMLTALFQWAPTLGGECYEVWEASPDHLFVVSFNGYPPSGVNATLPRSSGTSGHMPLSFNGHPPLGVNATVRTAHRGANRAPHFNGHPPLGVNATTSQQGAFSRFLFGFQWAPTLGGECYKDGVAEVKREKDAVSMGTHPWG